MNMKNPAICLGVCMLTSAAFAATALLRLPPSGSDGLATEALQSAIDDTSAAGGGVVSVPPGTWVTGQLHLKSGVTLELQRGATLLGSTNIADYVRSAPRCSLILAEGVRNVGLRGHGTLDGRGGSFSHDHLRPYLVRFSSCTNVACEDVSLRAGGAWTIFCLRCDGVVYRRLKIWSHVNYCNDGMDISSRNVLVEDCEIDSDDDGLALKTPEPDVVVENVEVCNCRIASSCNAIHLGTESWGTFRNVDIHDCRVIPPSACHRFDWRKSALGATEEMIGLAGITVMCVDGEVMENVRLRNLEMKGPTTPVFVRCDRRHPERPGVPSKMDGVLVENVRVEAASRVASSITGVPDLRPRNIVIRNFEVVAPGGGTLEDCALPVPECYGDQGPPTNLKFDCQALPAHGFYVRHADGVRFENVRTRCRSSDERPAIVIDDADVTVADDSGLSSGANGLGKVLTLTAEKRHELEERLWSSYLHGTAYYRAATGFNGAKQPLVVVLGVAEKDRAYASMVIGQGKRRGTSVLMPFGRTADSVLESLSSVMNAEDARRVYLKGDGAMASLALELLAAAPERFSGASVVALGKDVSADLKNLRCKAVDIVIAAGNARQAKAGFSAFNALVSAKDRVSVDDIDETVRTGKIPERIRYRGPSDPDFPSPNRVLAFRRESASVRISATSNRDVAAFDPSFGWIMLQDRRRIVGERAK